MKKSKFTEGQIVKILMETEITGKTIADVCRDYGIAQSTYYKWKTKYGGLDETSLRKMKQLERRKSASKKNVC